MAKKKDFLNKTVHEPIHHTTSIGRRPSLQIFESCDSWFHTNIKVLEKKKRKLFSNHVYHEYEGKQVIGYICGDEPPQ